MRTHQLESRTAVIKGGILPSGRIMAGSTIRPELAIVGIICGMTSHTLPGCSLENPVDVASRTRYASMRASKSKTGYLAMVKAGILPGTRVVTGTAVGTELSVVSVIRGVTGKTIRCRPFIISIDMTGSTRDTFMTSDQLETCQAVIEIYIVPITRVMAFCTVIPHLSHVDIGMAGSTCGWRIFESKIIMAIRTGYINVFTLQGKTHL